MKRTWMLFISLFLAACGNSEEEKVSVDQLVNQEWNSIEEQADGTEVRVFMWGGDEGINRYMDEWVAPTLKEEHGVNLTRTPMDTPEILQKLLTEKRAGQTQGTIDLFWLNGENFKNAKDHELLAGAFSQALPNYERYINQDELSITHDFGTPVEHFEAPFGNVQFVFAYDEEKVPTPPSTFEELKEWVKENPGKFTYPDANDFTGNAFLRHVFYESVGDVESLLDRGFDETYADENSQWMWEYLNDIKLYLWREGQTYPSSLEELDRLYSQGEVWMTMGYNEARAESFVENGVFPPHTKTFVLESGSIGNSHFLSIPFNAANPAGAMTAINFLLSPEAQFKKMDRSMWGENTVIDPQKLTMEQRSKLDEIDRGDTVLASEVLQEKRLPEVDSDYVNWIKENWLHEVIQSTP